ncbi:MAG: head GIN domain-containing protein [Bacteroidota bacterium]
MTKWKMLPLVLWLMILLSSCHEDSICEKGEGPIIREEIFLPAFHSIKNNTVADIYLQQGNEQKIIAEGQEDIIDLLELAVKSGEWEINFDRNCVYNFDGLKLFITLPEIRSVQAINGGNIYSDGLMKVDELTALTNGLGEIELFVEASRIDARTESRGSIKLSGTTNEAFYTIRGAGSIHGFELNTKITEAVVRHTGNVETTVTEELKVLIEGKGDVYYKGFPEKDITIDGQGEVKNVN